MAQTGKLHFVDTHKGGQTRNMNMYIKHALDQARPMYVMIRDMTHVCHDERHDSCTLRY